VFTGALATGRQLSLEDILWVSFFLERRTVDMCFTSKDKAAKQIAAGRTAALNLRWLSEIGSSGQCIAMAFGDNFQLYDAVRDLAAG
jgi:hypothetical protein